MGKAGAERCPQVKQRNGSAQVEVEVEVDAMEWYPRKAELSSRKEL